MPITQDQLDRVIGILSPYMDEENRQRFIKQSLSKRLTNKLTFAGDVDRFTSYLINEIISFDGEESNYQSMIDLLCAIRIGAVASTRQQIDQLIEELRVEPCVDESIPEQDIVGNQRDTIFICYTEADLYWHSRFFTAFVPAINHANLSVWSINYMETGDIIQDVIQKKVTETRIALLLVTSEFLADKELEESQLNPFLQAAKNNEIIIFWVAVSACGYQYSPIRIYRCANNPDEPLNSLSEAEQGRVITRIVDDIVRRMSS